MKSMWLYIVAVGVVIVLVLEELARQDQPFYESESSGAGGVQFDAESYFGGNIVTKAVGGIISGVRNAFSIPSDVSALIDKYSAVYGVDADLLKAQAYAESRGDQSARSRVGAIGVFQLMPATAKDLGVNPYDTEENIKGGAKYMAQLLKRTNGDQALALAEYNAGMGRVERYTPEIWGDIPPIPETQNYVAKILGLLGLA